MFSIPEQFSTALKSNVDSHLAMRTALASRAFDSIEELSKLNIKLAKSSLEEWAVATKQIMSATDPREFFSLLAHTQPNLEKALAYGRNVASIASHSHAELANATEAQVAEMKRKVTLAVDELAKNSPAGSDHAIALLKSAIENTNAVYDRLTKTTHQAVNVFEERLGHAAAQFAQGLEKREAVRASSPLNGPI